MAQGGHGAADSDERSGVPGRRRVSRDPSWELPAFTTTELAEKKRDACVLLPVKDQGDVLRDQLRRMQSQLHRVDVVLCDGASTDGSTDEAFLRECRVRTLLVAPEPGLSTATRVGLAYALDEGYRHVVLMDGNGKDRVSTISDVVDALEEGFDFVQTSRFLPGGGHANTPLERYLGIRFVCAPILSLASGFRYTDPTNSFKGLSRRYLLDPRLRPFRHVFRRYALHYQLNRMAPRLGYRTCEVPNVRAYPAADRGSIFRTQATTLHGLRPRLYIVGELLLSALGYYDVR